MPDGLVLQGFRGGAGAHGARKDVAFTPDVLDNLWLGTFPDAEVLRIGDAGHYLQEDAHERIVPALLAHLGAERPADT